MTKDRRFYISVEVDFFDHPKTIEVGERLALRHLRAVAWCHKHRTDGHMPREAALAIVGSRKAALALESAGLWEKCDDGWCVHDYLGHQQSREQLDAAAEAGRVAAEKRWAKRNG